MIRNNPGNARVCPGLQVPMYILGIYKRIVPTTHAGAAVEGNRYLTSTFTLEQRHLPDSVVTLYFRQTAKSSDSKANNLRKLCIQWTQNLALFQCSKFQHNSS